MSIPVAADSSPDAALAFVCSEIWGGNRPINRPIRAPGMQGKLFSKPCGGGSGGDVHYVSVCGSGLLARLCVADVAGHGETVACVSRELHQLLRQYMNHVDHRRVLTELNRRLESNESSRMTTAAAFTYYPPSGSLTYSYAGHPPAWLFDRAANRWERLTLDRPDDAPLVNVPLAISDQIAFTRGRRRVHVGDRLLVVTDGVLEAPAHDGELFGEERVEQLLQENRGLDSVALSDKLVEALVAFTGSTQLAHDDVTLLLLEFVPGPHGPAIWHAIRNRIVRPRGNSAALEARGAI